MSWLYDNLRLKVFYDTQTISEDQILSYKIVAYFELHFSFKILG